MFRPLIDYFHQSENMPWLCLLLYLFTPAPIALMRMMLETPLKDTLHTLVTLAQLLPAAYLVSGFQSLIFAFCMIVLRSLKADTALRLVTSAVLGGLSGYLIDWLTDGKLEFLYLGLMTALLVECLVTFVQRSRLQRRAPLATL